MKKPNFFIIGAPKCGTTSMASWLAEHPNIYMSPVKEPFFYSTDLNKRDAIRDPRIYKKLFAKVNQKHVAIGEASTLYLYSQVAVPRIEKECAGSKYIVMLRNPVEMAYSLHDHYLFLGSENITDFLTAWRLSPERRKGIKVPARTKEPKLLDYQSICSLGLQIERLLSHVERERILVLLLDDVKANPRREYLKVLQFLGVPDDGRLDFPVYNPAKEYRGMFARKFFLKYEALTLLMRRLGIVRHTGVLRPFLRPLKRVLIRQRKRPSLPREVWSELLDYYKPDILKLSALVNRDLSIWWRQNG